MSYTRGGPQVSCPAARYQSPVRTRFGPAAHQWVLTPQSALAPAPDGDGAPSRGRGPTGALGRRAAEVGPGKGMVPAVGFEPSYRSSNQGDACSVPRLNRESRGRGCRMLHRERASPPAGGDVPRDSYAFGAGGGIRTHSGMKSHRILSPAPMPVRLRPRSTQGIECRRWDSASAGRDRLTSLRVASSTWQSNGLLIRRFGVRIPGDPPAETPTPQGIPIRERPPASSADGLPDHRLITLCRTRLPTQRQPSRATHRGRARRRPW